MVKVVGGGLARAPMGWMICGVLLRTSFAGLLDSLISSELSDRALCRLASVVLLHGRNALAAIAYAAANPGPSLSSEKTANNLEAGQAWR